MDANRPRRRPNQPIKFKTTLRNTVLDVMRSRGWKETDSETDWVFFWADVGWIRDVYDRIRLDDSQHVNHFKNHYELTRKDLMVRNFRRMKKTLEKEDRIDEANKFDFFPITYSLPQDWNVFETEFRKHQNMVWIMKPPAKAQGRGIFLFTKLSQVNEWKSKSKLLIPANKTGAAASRLLEDDKDDSPEPYLAQRYIDNPHLVGGKKYDLRIYVLVTSYSPLTVWLHRTGFARFCHHRFSMADTDNTFIHVTNVAVQKTNPKYAAMSGSKWGVRNLRQYLCATVGDQATNKVFGEVQAMILRTLQSVQRIVMHNKHSSELYGYDVMLDDQLKPMLIETNASPSLTAETAADYHLKFNLLEDFFNVLDLEHRRTGDEIRVGGFDLIWNNGPVGITMTDPNACSIGSYLGCANELEIPINKLTIPPKLGGVSSERPLT